MAFLSLAYIRMIKLSTVTISLCCRDIMIPFLLWFLCGNLLLPAAGSSQVCPHVLALHSSYRSPAMGSQGGRRRWSHLVYQLYLGKCESRLSFGIPFTAGSNICASLMFCCFISFLPWVPPNWLVFWRVSEPQIWFTQSLISTLGEITLT